jgi:hypothetical protein
VHLEAIARTSAFARAELKGPELPAELAHVWPWFLELHAARSYHSCGPNAIAYQEIAAWSGLTGTPVGPADVDLLRLVDWTWITWAPSPAGGANASQRPA